MISRDVERTRAAGRDLAEALDVVALEARVAAAIRRERGPVAWMRSRSRLARVAMAALGLGALAGLVLLVKPRADLALYPALRLGLSAGGLVIVAVVAAWHALRPLHLPPVARWVPIAVFAVGVLGPVVLALLPEVPTIPSRAARYHAGWQALECFLVGSCSGLAVLLVARALHRGGRSGMDLALVGAAAGGLAGNLALALFCPYNYPEHLLLGHATAPLGVLVVFWPALKTRSSG